MYNRLAFIITWLLIITDNTEYVNGQVANRQGSLTTEDLELLKKEFGDDFTELLLPGFQVDLTEVLGEGMHYTYSYYMQVCYITCLVYAIYVHDISKNARFWFIFLCSIFTIFAFVTTCMANILHTKSLLADISYNSGLVIL